MYSYSLFSLYKNKTHERECSILNVSLNFLGLDASLQDHAEKDM